MSRIESETNSGAVRLASIFNGLVLVSAILSAPWPMRADQVGIPWTGQSGVTETVSEIMARDKNLPLQSSLKPAQSDEGRLLPNRKNLQQYSPSPHIPQSPAETTNLTASALVNPQSLGVSFLAAQISESGYIPPDSMGAVGPSQVLVCVNGRIRVFDKSGAVGALDTTPATFFASQSISTPSDPRVRYDRLSGRWFVVMIDVPHSKKNNKIVIAVSSGPIIAGSSSFTFFSFIHSSPSGGGDSGFFADYPTLGIDIHALYIGANMFSGNTYEGTSGYVIKKADLLAGTLTVTAFRQLSGMTGPGPVTPQGVDNDDPLATQGFFIGVDNESPGLLVIRRISSPGAVPSISGNINLTVPPTVAPVGGVPALGSSIGLDALDDRLFAARMHNGSLWTAHNLQVDSSGAANSSGDRKGSRWYEIINLTGTPTLRQSGTLFDGAPGSPANYWIPSCMVNGQGHMVLGCSVAGVNEFAEIAVTGRYATDPLGTLQPPAVVQTSSTAYNVADSSSPHRWGDYSLTSVDPGDDMTFWTVQEYCNANNSWGVRVLQIKAPPPATLLSCNPASVSAGSTGITVVVTGASTNGSGFFDPGPAFTNHIGAILNGGGVTVNSVIYTDPTHLTLNVTAFSGAMNGPRSLTVTNPDGQAVASASGIFSIIGGNTNQPPSLSAIANQTINEDAISSVAFVVGDLETAADSLTLTASSSNTNLVPLLNVSFGGTGPTRTLNVIPATNQNGVATITITVTDGGGATASGSFVLTVNPVNDPPSFNPGPNQTVLENAGSQTVVNWATTISAGPPNESGQALSFVLTNDNSSLFAVQPGIAPNGTLTYTPASSASGTATVAVQLQDDGGTANSGVDTSPLQTFTITVLPVNDAPSFSKGPDQTVMEDAGPQAVLNWASAIIPGPPNEGSQTLSFILTNDNQALFSAQPLLASNGTLTFTPAPDANGSATVTVRLHDDGGTANGGIDTSLPQLFTITVLPVNDAPVLAPIDAQTIDEGIPLIVHCSAFDVDSPPSALTFTLLDPPAGALIDTMTGVLTWTPSEEQGPATNTLVVVVSDDGSPSLSATQRFTVVVREVNLAPVLNPIANRMLHQGSSLMITNHATDADLPVNILTYSLSNAPAGATIDSASGVFSWTPTAEQVNTTNLIAVTVTDNGSPPLSDTRIFTATVLSPPLITSITVSNNVLALAWNAIIGTKYQVQFTPALDLIPSWENLSDPVTPTETPATKIDPDGLVTQRFYRILVQP